MIPNKGMSHEPLLMPRSVRTTKTSLHSSPLPGKLFSSPCSCNLISSSSSSLLSALSASLISDSSGAARVLVLVDPNENRPIERAWPMK